MCGLPYRIRAPLARLKEKKSRAESGEEAAVRPGGLGDGEKLESNATNPDYVRLALTSRVYDMVAETPLQFASGLSARLSANVHLKREDLLPSFSFKLRGAYNLLAHDESDARSGVITYTVGSLGHSVAVAARALGIPSTIVVPERVPLKRRLAIERAGARVIVHGQTLKEAEQYVHAQVAADPSLHLVQPHDHPHVIAGQGTVALETVKQIGPALEGTADDDRLDAIFVVAGGSSLLAGVAAVMKSIMPTTKVIGVEAGSADLLHRSLLNGHRLTAPEPAHFVDGASVTQLGSEVFRLCNELVDDIVTVSDDEICAAVRDAFEDTRAVLEPAGAIAIAGLKKYVDAMPKTNGSKGNFVAISSDASNIEFDILRFIAERAAIGEQREKLFAMRMPDRTGMFFDMYKAVQPRLVTEFVYRHSPTHNDALVYMSVESSDTDGPDFSKDVIAGLDPLGVYAVDITDDELGKTHAKHLAGGRPGELPGERTIRFEFPENAGALHEFLASLKTEWFLTMLHYRNHGGQVGKVLAGVRVPPGEEAAFSKVLEDLGHTFYDETGNKIYTEFMR